MTTEVMGGQGEDGPSMDTKRQHRDHVGEALEAGRGARGKAGTRKAH